MKLSDYICYLLREIGIERVFMICGGYAMHLNDSVNNYFKNITYQYHEQVAGYSALGYGKMNFKPALLCITSGNASVNCLSSVVSAYQDNIPMIIVSGQVQSIITTKNNRGFRHLGGAEVNITKIVKSITKNSIEINNIYDALKIKSIIDSAIEGRKGPVWISIPVDLQSLEISNMERILIKPKTEEYNDEIDLFLENYSKPLILAGNGIRNADCIYEFRNFVKKYRIPVVTSFMAVDIYPSNDQYFAGRVGINGELSGNISLDKCDLLIVFGCRLAYGLVGYKPEDFAKNAFIIMVDIEEEYNKNYLYDKINMIYNYDLKKFIENVKLNDYIVNEDWLHECFDRKQKFFSISPDNYKNGNKINPHHLIEKIDEIFDDKAVFVAASGTSVVHLYHKLNIYGERRFINNSQGDMGCEIPMTIGAYLYDKTKTYVCILGDGSFQLNSSELQNIKFNKIKIIIFVINNNGFGAIKITQRKFFGSECGTCEETGLSFPNIKKICDSYDIDYLLLEKPMDLIGLKEKIDKFEKPLVIEVVTELQERFVGSREEV